MTPQETQVSTGGTFPRSLLHSVTGWKQPVGCGLMVTRGSLVLTDPLLYQVHRAAHHGSQGLPFRGCEWGEIQLALGGLILGHNCYLSSPFAPENSLHSWLSPHLKIGVV